MDVFPIYQVRKVGLVPQGIQRVGAGRAGFGSAVAAQRPLPELTINAGILRGPEHKLTGVGTPSGNPPLQSAGLCTGGEAGPGKTHASMPPGLVCKGTGSMG